MEIIFFQYYKIIIQYSFGFCSFCEGSCHIRIGYLKTIFLFLWLLSIFFHFLFPAILLHKPDSEYFCNLRFLWFLASMPWYMLLVLQNSWPLLLQKNCIWCILFLSSPSWSLNNVPNAFLFITLYFVFSKYFYFTLYFGVSLLLYIYFLLTCFSDYQFFFSAMSNMLLNLSIEFQIWVINTLYSRNFIWFSAIFLNPYLL